MKKTIMILGGGYYQLPLIKASRKTGYRTIICGIRGNYPGYDYADKWFDVDIFDKEACLFVAHSEKINGICSCGADTVLPTMGYIVEKMDLRGCDFASSVRASDKALMKERLFANGVRTANYCKIYSLPECCDFARKYGYPVVLKVVDASGSKGVAIVRNEKELQSYYPSISTATTKPYIIIEEYIAGIEFGAQAYVKEKQLVFVMPHGDIVFQEDAGVPIGHYVPYLPKEININDVTIQIEKCVQTLGINNTALNVDFILKDGLSYVLEIGARAGATCLPELVNEYYGINYYEYILKNCAGDDMEFPLLPREKTACIAETLISRRAGKVKSITLPEMDSRVLDFKLYPKIGDMVQRFRSAYDRIGHIIVKGNTLDEIQPIMNSFHKEFKIEFE